MKTKAILALALAALVAGATSQANAKVWWALNDVTFSDGGTATGSFSVAPSAYYASGWVTSTAGANAGGLAYTFLGLNNSGVNLPSDDTIMTAHPEDAHGAPLYYYTLVLEFADPLTTAIDDNRIVAGYECETWAVQCTDDTKLRSVTGGFANAPEAPTWAMMIVGAGLFGCAGIRLRQRPEARTA